MAVSQHIFAQIAKQVQMPAPVASRSWSAPSVGELIARIDAALMQRQSS